MAKKKEETIDIVVDTDRDIIVQLKNLVKQMATDAKLELTEEQLNLVSINWNTLIRPEGKIKIGDNEYVTLAELRRLARLRGYVSSMPTVVQVPVYENHRNATVQWEIVWKDGTADGAAADASWRTCNPGFRNFTVAIAGNRAEARCIRAALGIEACSYEEIGPDDEDLSGPANDAQKSAIAMLLERRKITSAEQIIALLGPEVSSRILDDKTVNLTNLTHQDAVHIMAAINRLNQEKK